MLRSTLTSSSILLFGLGLYAFKPSTADAAEGIPNRDRQIVLEFTGNPVGIEVGAPGSGVLRFPGVFTDPSTGRIVGTGDDTLDLNTVEGGDPFAGENFVVSNTTTFNLHGGTIVTQNRTSVAPFTQGTTGATEDEVTHLTGDFSRGVILSGTGRYQGITGTVRLSGAVDMSQFTGGPGSPIDFNCLFVFDVD